MEKIVVLGGNMQMIMVFAKIVMQVVTNAQVQQLMIVLPVNQLGTLLMVAVKKVHVKQDGLEDKHLCVLMIISSLMENHSVCQKH